MSAAATIARLRSLLPALARLDLGYPRGDHLVRKAAPVSAAAKLSGWSWLAPVYAACDGFSLPDVHNGLFLDTSARVAAPERVASPQSVRVDDHDVPVLGFGSTGGGDLFVVEVETGRVRLVPPGAIEDGRCRARSTVVGSVAEFLERVVADVKAFVAADAAHVYLGRV